jgi:hypothetical protein
VMSHQVAQYKQLERAFGKDGVPALLIEQALLNRNQGQRRSSTD